MDYIERSFSPKNSELKEYNNEMDIPNLAFALGFGSPYLNDMRWYSGTLPDLVFPKLEEVSIIGPAFSVEQKNDSYSNSSGNYLANYFKKKETRLKKIRLDTMTDIILDFDNLDDDGKLMQLLSPQPVENYLQIPNSLLDANTPHPEILVLTVKGLYCYKDVAIQMANVIQKDLLPNLEVLDTQDDYLIDTQDDIDMTLLTNLIAKGHLQNLKSLKLSGSILSDKDIQNIKTAFENGYLEKLEEIKLVSLNPQSIMQNNTAKSKLQDLAKTITSFDKRNSKLKQIYICKRPDTLKAPGHKTQMFVHSAININENATVILINCFHEW